MTDAIQYIQPESLDSELLEQWVYPAPQDLYWSDSFDPDFYRNLARAGFISICVKENERCFLIPEIQAAYAVLDWENIHVGRQVRRILRSGALEHQDVVLCFERNPQAVMDGIAACHGERNWLHEPYRELVGTLASQSDADFCLLGVELRSRSSGALIGGELGYAMGAVWTSLSGFLYRDHPAWNHFGTVQLLALARVLQDSGFAFWNLGHPYMDYKTALGARVLPRAEFLERWRAGLAAKPAVRLGSITGKSFSCQELLSG